MSDLLDVEYVTIGALLLAPQQLELVRGWLRPEDFARPLCGELLGVMLTMHDERRPVDPVTVLGELRRLGRLRPDGWPGAELLTMTRAVPTPRAAVYYGRLVLEDAMFRLVEQTGVRLTQVGQHRRGTVEDAFTTLTAQVRQLAASQARWRDSGATSRTGRADAEDATRGRRDLDRDAPQVTTQATPRAVSR